MSPLMCGFLDAGKKEAAQAQLTGVQKAPRHEVAGGWAPAEQRALWGFNAGAELDDGWDADRIRPACLLVREVSGVQEAFRRGFGARQRAIHAIDGCDWVERDCRRRLASGSERENRNVSRSSGS